MTAFTVTVSDQTIRDALNRLAATGRNMSPILQTIGEGIMERTKQRFTTATGPDGQPWKPNSPATLAAYIKERGGYGKRGLNKKGHALAAGKKPLQGHSGDLAREFHLSVDGSSVIVGHITKYAAIQQFGGAKAQFPNLWGNIPARPFLPVTADGQLYPQEREQILALVANYIQNAVKG